MEKSLRFKFCFPAKMLPYLLVGLLYFAPDLAFAQNLPVSGTVTEQGNGSPIIGATVQVQGTNRGAITDLDGRYAIEVPEPDAVLVFSYIGYTAQEITVGNRSTINIVLESSAEELSEVVVTALGV